MKHPYSTREEDHRPSLPEISKWEGTLRQLHQRLVPHFARPEPLQHALLFLQAVVSEIPRKNGWQIAEQARQARPYGMQRLLSRAVWDVDGVRDEVRSYVLEQLGPDANAVVVLDESSFPKRGNKSAGVKKQHCGSTRRRENCQVGVFLTYVTTRGHALVDRDLYVPEDWLADRERCRKAGIADRVEFHPKWELALHMLKRGRRAGLPFSWVVADAVYGRAVDLRTWLETHGYAYVLAVGCDEAVCVQAPDDSYLLAQAQDCDATLLKEQDWHRLAMSQGTKGPRLFDWARLPLVHRGGVDGRHWLLVRRCVDDPEQKTSYLVFAPLGTSLAQMVWAIGKRWHIEEDLQATKALGLDHYEVRQSIGWYRHITLVLLVYAFLVGIGVHDTSHLPMEPSCEHAQPLLALTSSEVRHLLARLFFPLPSSASLVQSWSWWRRQHQYWASYYHCQHRLKAG